MRKFSFSEKATKIYLVNAKTVGQIAQMFVAFSVKLNFNPDLGCFVSRMRTFHLISNFHDFPISVGLKMKSLGREMNE